MEENVTSGYLMNYPDLGDKLCFLNSYIDNCSDSMK